ncbi:MAG: hypothetical protein V1740_03705 [Candidatus Woesearchaeota archaeon]
MTEEDRIRQIHEAIDFMFRRIPDEHLSDGLREGKNLIGDYGTPFGHYYLQNVICDSFVNSQAILNYFLDEICHNNDSRLRKKLMKIARASARSMNIHTPETLPLMTLMSDPHIFSCGYACFFERSMASVLSKIKKSEAKDNPFIRSMQEKLFMYLMECNKPFIDLVRNLNYDLVESKEFLLHPEDFLYHAQGTRKRLKSAICILDFGRLVCHIGYFPKPQFGKWDSLYAEASGKSLDEQLREGIVVVERSEREIVEDLRAQNHAQTLMFKRLIHLYVEGIERLEAEQKNCSRTKEENAHLEQRLEEYRSRQAELFNRYKSVEAGYDELVQKAVAGATQDLTLQVEALSAQAEQFDDERKCYEARLRKLDHELVQKSRILSSVERLQWARSYEERIAAVPEEGTDSALYSIVFHSDVNSDASEDVLGIVSEKLSTGKGNVRKIQKRGDNNKGYIYLKRSYPMYDDFFVFNIGKHRRRAILSVSGENELTVLRILDHGTYDHMMAGDI